MATKMKRLSFVLILIQFLCLSSLVTSFVPRNDRRRSTRRKSKDVDHDCAYDRRGFFNRIATCTGTANAAAAMLVSFPANARGLVSFPCVMPLLNVYHFMRAGTSLLEEADIWSTNPLFLTNREAALSEKGIQEVQVACRILQDADISPSVIKYSLAASSVDTAMVIRDELKVGQNRLIPEFTFMDPRAIGKWDMRSIVETFPAVVAMDELEAGKDGKGARPPPNTDGTPQDTLADQAIRLRQLMSVLETQFSGDNIVLVFPDGSTPALLSAMMAGIPYNKAHVLEFTPGEIRLDIRMAPTLKLYETKLQANAEKYDTLVQQGKVELDRLRSLTEEELVSKKDLIIEKERIEIEAEYQRKEAARLTKEEDERQARVTRQRELETSRLKSRGIVVDASSDGTMDEASVPPLIIGGAFAAYAVVALSSAGQNESKYKGSNDTNLVQPIANLAVNTTGEPLRPGSIGNPVSLYSDTSIINNYSELQGDIFSDLLGDASSTTYENNPSLYGSVPKSKEERQEDARNAMQSYMDEDDGAHAWLQVMANIIRDDDDENDIFLLDSEDKDGIGRVKGSD